MCVKILKWLLYTQILNNYSMRISAVAQSCPTLCNPMDCSTPGFPVHHQLLKLTQTHVHQVSDAIQPSHPLSSDFGHIQCTRILSNTRALDVISVCNLYFYL